MHILVISLEVQQNDTKIFSKIDFYAHFETCEIKKTINSILKVVSVKKLSKSFSVFKCLKMLNFL